MPGELTPDGTTGALIMLVLIVLLAGLVLESIRVLARLAADALRGMATVVSAMIVLAVMTALLAVEFIR